MACVATAGLAASLAVARAPQDDPPSPIGATPSPRQRAWHDLQVYGFVHFTVNTFTDKEWGYGDEPESIFNPSGLDARQWVPAARDAGMTGLIVTAKHHDGFCLWPRSRHDVAIARHDPRGARVSCDFDDQRVLVAALVIRRDAARESRAPVKRGFK